MKIKWNLYWAAALFAGYLLVSNGVPLLPVLAGIGITAGVQFWRSHRLSAHK